MSFDIQTILWMFFTDEIKLTTIMNFILKVPKEENLISQIKRNYNKLVTQNYGQSKTETSSHWQKYLPTVKIELISRGGCLRDF